jgi:glutaredoxin-related protein
MWTVAHNLQNELINLIDNTPVLLITQNDCERSEIAKEYLEQYPKLIQTSTYWNVDEQEYPKYARQLLRIVTHSHHAPFPALFVRGEFIGTLEEIVEMDTSGEVHDIFRLKYPWERTEQ